MRLTTILGGCLLIGLSRGQFGGGRAGRFGSSITGGETSSGGLGASGSPSLGLSGLGDSAKKLAEAAPLPKTLKMPKLLGGAELMQLLQGRAQLDLDLLDDLNPVARTLKEAIKTLVKRAIDLQGDDEAKPDQEDDSSPKKSKGRKRVSDISRRRKRAAEDEQEFSEDTPGYMKVALKSLKMKVRSTRVDRNGDKHYRLDLHFEDILVLGGELEYSEYEAGEITTISFPEDRIPSNGGSGGRTISKEKSESLRGNLHSGFDYEMPDYSSVDVDSLTRGFQDSFLQAKSSLSGFAFDPDRTEQRYVILVNEADQNQPIRLALELKLLGANADRTGAERPFVLIDPFSGDVIRQYDALASTSEYGAGSGGNQKIGKKAYQNSDDLRLRLTREGDSCFYENNFVVTYKLGGANANQDYPYSLPCGKEETEEVNGGFGPINDAHLNIDSASAFFFNRYGEGPLGKDKVVEILVQGAVEDNAYWDGRALNLNTGKDLFYPLVAADVAAHELGHGILEVNSNLEYKNESGGLNEAFADMTGKIAETYILGTAAPDNWKIGDEIYKSEGKALRYMDEPSLDGHSIEHYSDYEAGMDVHYSSGIMNKAFTLITEKPSFSISEAYDMFFVANWYYWRSTSTLADGASGALRAMCGLKEGKLLGYNYDHIQLSEAVDAFEVVGIACAPLEGGDCKYHCEKAAKKA